VHVKNEAELKNAINNAPIGGSTTIAIDNDITLTSYETSEQYTGAISAYIITLHLSFRLTRTSHKQAIGLMGFTDNIRKLVLHVKPNKNKINRISSCVFAPNK